MLLGMNIDRNDWDPSSTRSLAKLASVLVRDVRFLNLSPENEHMPAMSNNLSAVEFTYDLRLASRLCQWSATVSLLQVMLSARATRYRQERWFTVFAAGPLGAAGGRSSEPSNIPRGQRVE